MPALQAADIDGLVASTLPKFGRLKWTDLTTDIQNFTILGNIMNKNKVTFKGGISYKFNVQTGHSSQAQNTGLFQDDNVNITDHLAQGEVPFRHTVTSYAYDLREEYFNSGQAEQIVDLLETRRHEAMVSLAELLENDYWGKPASSADTRTPWGLQYYMVYGGDGAANIGFTGGNPSGFANCAGIDASAVARWRNYSFGFTNISNADGVDKLSDACRLTKFEPPVRQPNYAEGETNQCQWYTTNQLMKEMEQVGKAQNDNLGKDLLPFQGKMLIQGCPVNHVPILDPNPADPLFGVNWAHIRPMFQTGWYMKEDGPVRAANSHNVRLIFIDTTHNLLCRNRRPLIYAQREGY